LQSFFIILCIVQHGFGQRGDLKSRTSDVVTRSKADTSRFSADKTTGWSLYNSYVEPIGKDSVLLEVIIRHDRNIKWEQFQYFGRITDRKMLPAQTQEVKYFLITDEYVLKVEANGHCSISLSDGQLPPRDPVILPIRIVYKRT
jgi:hypothetical protein